jgi:hypothetical protein
LERSGGFYAGRTIAGVGSDDDIAALRKRAFRERLECAAPHYHGLADGQFFEVSQIGTYMKREVAAASDLIVAPHGGYQ